MRINVIGTSGSGKSTLAKKVSEILNVPHIEMDQLFWKPNWVESSDSEFLANLKEQLAVDAWVLDGNYSRTLPIKWKNVELVIWVDYSLPRTLSQALKRAFLRLTSGVELWPGTGNRESLRKLFSRQSIILWTINTYYPNKKKMQALMDSKEYAHIRFIRVRTPREMKAVIASLKKRSPNPCSGNQLD